MKVTTLEEWFELTPAISRPINLFTTQEIEIMNSNLPPGCSVSDIPVNRPEDTAAEAFAEMVDEKLEEFGLSFNDKGSPIYPKGAENREAFYALLVEWIEEVSKEAFDRGYEAGLIAERAGSETGEVI